MYGFLQPNQPPAATLYPANGTAHDEFNQGTGNNDRCKHTYQNPNRQGNGKPLNHAGPKVAPKTKQDEANDERGQVGIAYGRPGPVKPSRNGFRKVKASAQLFFDAFENENIGIYGHTGGEQETGNGGQGEEIGRASWRGRR